jgi:hypothetical protein
MIYNLTNLKWENGIQSADKPIMFSSKVNSYTKDKTIPPP